MKNNLPFPLNKKRGVIFTLYARNGLYMSLKDLNNKGIILVPSYACGDEIQSIKEAGFSVLVYNVKRNLGIDMLDIKRKIVRGVVGILLIHYFGFPQEDIKKLKAICKSKNIFLIEDCAHCIKTSYEHKRLGLFGDISVFSLRKFLPIPHGGVLLVNNKKLFNKRITFLNPPQKAIKIDQYVYEKIHKGLILPGTPIGNIYKDMRETIRPFGPRLERFGGYKLAISESALKKIYKTDIGKIISERRGVYKKLIKFFQDNKNLNLAPIFSTYNRNVVPLFFPVITKSCDTSHVVSSLKKEGIHYIRPFWDHYHDSIDIKSFADVMYLYNHLLIIPLSEEVIKGSFFDTILRILKQGI